MEKEEKFLQNSNEIIRQAYKALNYRIVETSARTNNAIVFFSGNGLYFPNTKEVFENVILNSDRYEWENIINLLFLCGIFTNNGILTVLTLKLTPGIRLLNFYAKKQKDIK